MAKACFLLILPINSETLMCGLNKYSAIKLRVHVIFVCYCTVYREGVCHQKQIEQAVS